MLARKVRGPSWEIGDRDRETGQIKLILILYREGDPSWARRPCHLGPSRIRHLRASGIRSFRISSTSNLYLPLTLYTPIPETVHVDCHSI